MPMKNVHDTCMLPTPGARLSKAWFMASTRKLESLVPFLSDEDADRVCEELNDREEASLTRNCPRDELDYPHNYPIEY